MIILNAGSGLKGVSMNKVIGITFLSAIIAIFICSPLLGDTPTSSDGESKEKNPKPWITDSQTLSFKRNEDRFMDNVKDLLKQYPQRTETYERINMAQLAYSPEEYVGRRFVFDGCAVRQRFRPADEYLAHRTLAGYVAFDIKPLTGGKKY